MLFFLQFHVCYTIHDAFMHYCVIHLLCGNTCSKHCIRKRAALEGSNEDDGPKQCGALDSLVHYQHLPYDCHCHVDDHNPQGNCITLAVGN